MVNVWTIFVILPYFYIPSMSSLIPANKGGCPIPLKNLVDKLLPGNTESDVQEAIEFDIWKLSMEEMGKYCQILSKKQPPKFVEGCKKVENIYKRKFGIFRYKDAVKDKNFPAAGDFDRYLQYIEQENDVEVITEKLKGAVVWMGWNDIRKFCKDNKKSTYNEACEFVKGILVKMSAWNFEPQPVMQARQQDTHARQPVMQARQQDTHARQSVMQARQQDTHAHQPVMQARQQDTHARQSVMQARQQDTHARQSVMQARQSVPQARQQDTEATLNPMRKLNLQN